MSFDSQNNDPYGTSSNMYGQTSEPASPYGSELNDQNAYSQPYFGQNSFEQNNSFGQEQNTYNQNTSYGQEQNPYAQSASFTQETYTQADPYAEQTYSGQNTYSQNQTYNTYPNGQAPYPTNGYQSNGFTPYPANSTGANSTSIGALVTGILGLFFGIILTIVSFVLAHNVNTDLTANDESKNLAKIAKIIDIIAIIFHLLIILFVIFMMIGFTYIYRHTF